MNLFKKLETWLPQMEQKLAGVNVVYYRGAEKVTVPAAVVGQTRQKSEETGGTWQTMGDRDYLIGVADLGRFGVPQIGDKIVETAGGQELVFVVANPGTDSAELPWRYSGPDRVTWRITVKLMRKGA